MTTVIIQFPSSPSALPLATHTFQFAHTLDGRDKIIWKIWAILQIIIWVQTQHFMGIIWHLMNIHLYPNIGGKKCNAGVLLMHFAN